MLRPLLFRVTSRNTAHQCRPLGIPDSLLIHSIPVYRLEIVRLAGSLRFAPATRRMSAGPLFNSGVSLLVSLVGD